MVSVVDQMGYLSYTCFHELEDLDLNPSSS